MKGLIHSFESFGTKDGPGIRFVFFMQGCPLRCLYCHNPDTWNMNDKKYELAPEEAFEEVKKVKNFIRNGGITISGGEPLLQPQFIIELFKMCKNEGLHTAIDTSGYILNDKVKEVLEHTDLVLLDIKHINPDKYKNLTAKQLEPTLRFMQYLSEIEKPAWLRYVLVPGFTDDEKDLNDWAKQVSEYKNVQRVDILPFHQMGLHKWEQLGEDYKLKDIAPPEQSEIEEAENIFRNYGLKV
ncbi:pyruvate formate lyase-activating protein [Dysgonomonas mossii]|uniref:Pyruvate formate-lyase-activating enzyme n=1 Tax=Dysgonomonas mossii TaxID=163665 RepID=A0A4Y9ILC6_9BACT|nr:pyruvate formate-lyase-activating protein [Dysgonomonas mossii]MBF0761724.1 pyruvate formate lyase-activating protein [Dysgonomonas mossii]TFU89357.1 pyruvate formate lyase-activating protein [Dysgonomonas mossii]